MADLRLRTLVATFVAVPLVAAVALGVQGQAADAGSARAATDAALAVERLETDETIAALEAELAEAQATVDAQAAEIAVLEARIAELEAQLPSPTPSPSPSPTPAPCVGVQATTAADIAGAPQGATICVTGEIRVTSPITLKADQILTGGGSLNGSVVLSGWQAGSGTWSVGGQTQGPTEVCMAGLNPCGGDEMVVPIARFADDVFYDDLPLERVVDLATLRAAPMPAFFFDYAADVIHVNRDPNGHLLELARSNGILDAGGADVTLRDITVEKSLGIGIRASNGWTLERVTAQLHTSGIRISNDFSMVESRSLWNGMLAMGGSGSNVQIIDSELATSNYRRYAKAPRGGAWSSGATKFTHVSNLTILGLWSHDHWNDCLWIDHDGDDVEIGTSDSGRPTILEGCTRLGLFWEFMDEPDDSLHLHDAIIRDNGADGLRLSDAGQALIERVVFGGNGAAGFAVSDSSRSGGPAGTVFRDNEMNGDTSPGCQVATVTCSGNTA